MPKLTRDDKFQKSFKDFIKTLTNTYHDLHEYSFISLTENKNRSAQCYSFTIPSNIVDYHVDTFIAGSDGIIIPPGPVMKKQILPDPITVQNRIHDYFKDYYLIDNDMVVSYVNSYSYMYHKDKHRVYQDAVDKLSIEEHNRIIYDYDLTILCKVVYYKSHIPFPVTLSTKDEFEKRCKQLEDRNNELCINIRTVTEMYQDKEEQYDILRRKMRIERRNTENKYHGMFEKMQKKFREYYAEKNSKDDCPVCYEVIDSSKLKVPGCCHTICTDCAERCSSCPICRESY
jgi:hypothetical protein